MKTPSRECDFNRLVIIGNGFDLSLKMKTSYSDFILWYLKKSLMTYMSKGKYKDPCLSFKAMHSWNSYPSIAKQGLESNNLTEFNSIMNEAYISVNYNWFVTKIVDDYRWVDIESVYYENLVGVLEDSKIKDDKQKKKKITELNDSLNHLRNELEEYIKLQCNSIDKELIKDDHREFLNKVVHSVRFKNSNIFKPFSIPDPDECYPDHTLFLDFNYTNTLEELLMTTIDARKYFQMKIHGDVFNDKNPIIFGYGDDTHPYYRNIENCNDDDYLKNIKSFSYLKTKLYHQFLNFMNSKPFEVYIIGHSCGLSDRTMLKSIFEHENCLNIQLFHRGSYDGYFKKVIAISRHFDNKPLYREKMVSFDESMIIPQVKE